MPVNVHFSNGVWNTGQFVCYLDHGLNTGPFNDQTGFNHLNIGFVRYSDPHYSMMKLADTEYILVMFDIWSYGFYGHMVFYLFGHSNITLVSLLQSSGFLFIRSCGFGLID